MIVAANPELALLILRLGLGILFLAHGPSKITKSEAMSKGMGMSANMVMLVGLAETLGALSMILGIRTDIGALLLGAVMVGAIYFKTQKWGKKFTGDGGWELDFIILAAAITVLLSGSSGLNLL